MKLIPMCPAEALRRIEDAQHICPEKPFDFAIAVGDDDKIIGVIGMYADGVKCSLGHLWTSGEPLVGSVLYGAAWRACKALGYTEVSL